MSIKNLKIKGLRGFREEVNIEFAIPDRQNPGSGLTVLVGPNNSGKSTVIEAVHLLNGHSNIIPSNARNEKTEGGIEIIAEDVNGNTLSLKSTENKGAYVERRNNNRIIEHRTDNIMNTFVLSSKRSFSSTFHNNSYQTRDDYKGNTSQSDYRNESNVNNNFGGRLLKIYKENRTEFDKCLEKVLSPLPNWEIDANDINSLYLKFIFDDVNHNSNGAGDGYINIFNIVDALYDSTENNVIFIDEPEISLHPDLQRKLFALLVEYSKDKQIIVSTHSPYFVDWELFLEYSKIIRFKKIDNTIRLFELSQKSREGIKSLIADPTNPHILDLNANEIFFLNDNVILTEGQDDVVGYKMIFKEKNYKTKASFFGWGAGGAPKMKFALNILKDLGYEKVFVILDNDEKTMISGLKDEYPEYEYYAIATNDIRNKKINTSAQKCIDKIDELEDLSAEKKAEITETIRKNFKEKEGLIAKFSKVEFEINKEYNQDIDNLLEKIKEYFEKDAKAEFGTGKSDASPNKEISENFKAHQLLYKWENENKIIEEVQSRYKKFNFEGGGGEVSFRKFKEHKYYAIVEQGNYISQNHGLVIYYEVEINTLKNKVVLKKRRVMSNTLPVSNISKFIEKTFHKKYISRMS